MSNENGPDPVGGLTTLNSENSAPQTQQESNETTEEQKTVKFPQTYITSAKARVRKEQALDSDLVQDLDGEAIVTVEEIIGRRARISEPVHGWLSSETSDGKSIITKVVDARQKKVGESILWLNPDLNYFCPGKVIDFSTNLGLFHCEFMLDNKERWIDLKKNTHWLGKCSGLVEYLKKAPPSIHHQLHPQLKKIQNGQNFGQQPFNEEPRVLESYSHFNKKKFDKRDPGFGPETLNNQSNYPYPSGHGPAEPPHHRGMYEKYLNRRQPNDPGSKQFEEFVPPPQMSQMERHRRREMGDMGPMRGGPDPQSRRYFEDMMMARRHENENQRRMYDKSKNSRYNPPPDHKIRERLRRGPPEQHNRFPNEFGNRPQPESYFTNYNRRDVSKHRGRKINQKVLIILRGFPGSGKTRLSRSIASRFGGHHVICSEDRYHWTGGDVGLGKFQFNPEINWKTRDWCAQEVVHALKDGIPLVIIDNINYRIIHYEEHIRTATSLGYTVKILEFIHNPEFIPIYRSHCKLNLAQEEWARLNMKWENDPRAQLLYPAFYKNQNYKNNQEHKERGEPPFDLDRIHGGGPKDNFRRPDVGISELRGFPDNRGLEELPERKEQGRTFDRMGGLGDRISGIADRKDPRFPPERKDRFGQMDGLIDPLDRDRRARMEPERPIDNGLGRAEMGISRDFLPLEQLQRDHPHMSKKGIVERSNQIGMNHPRKDIHGMPPIERADRGVQHDRPNRPEMQPRGDRVERGMDQWRRGDPMADFIDQPRTREEMPEAKNQDSTIWSAAAGAQRNKPTLDTK